MRRGVSISILITCRVRSLPCLLGVIVATNAIAILATIIITIQSHKQKANVNTRDIHCDNQLEVFTNLNAVDAQWQNVANTRHKFYVYSAFLDSPTGLVVIGAADRTYPDNVWCRLWLNDTCSWTVKARVLFIGEHHNMLHGACFVSCPLDSSLRSVVRSVSIVKHENDRPSNRLQVVRQEAPRREPTELSVCLKAFHGGYNKTIELVEFLEYYSMHGAKHFTFYGLNGADPAVRCILKDYEARGKAELLSWDLLGMDPDLSIHFYGQLAAINDCIFRHRQVTEHVAVVDTDEFIVPRENTTGTLVDLLHQLELGGARVGSFLFQSAFFYSHPPGKAVTPSRLLTQTRTLRRPDFFEVGWRSKYVCKPEAVLEGLIHHVWEYIDGYEELMVDVKVAAVHHYRDFDGDGKVKVEDRSALRYSHELTARVNKQWRHLAAVCQLA